MSQGLTSLSLSLSFTGFSCGKLRQTSTQDPCRSRLLGSDRFVQDGEHEGLYAVLLCRVVGGRTTVITNNDINIDGLRGAVFDGPYHSVFGDRVTTLGKPYRRCGREWWSEGFLGIHLQYLQYIYTNIYAICFLHWAVHLWWLTSLPQLLAQIFEHFDRAVPRRLVELAGPKLEDGVPKLSRPSEQANSTAESRGNGSGNALPPPRECHVSGVTSNLGGMSLRLPIQVH